MTEELSSISRPLEASIAVLPFLFFLEFGISSHSYLNFCSLSSLLSSCSPNALRETTLSREGDAEKDPFQPRLGQGLGMHRQGFTGNVPPRSQRDNRERVGRENTVQVEMKR